MRRGAVVLALCVMATTVFAQAPLGPQSPASKQQQNAQKPKPPSGEAKQADGQTTPAQSGHEPTQTGAEQQKPKETDEAGYVGWSRRKLVAFIEFADRNDKAIVAVGTILIAAFTVILGLATVFLWLATKKLVTGAEKTAEQQLRSYLGIDHTRFTETELFASYDIGFKNFGATPAHNVRAAVDSELRDHGDTTAFRKLVPDITFGSVFPSEGRDIFGVEDRAFTTDEWNSIRSGSTILYVFGVIIYEDCFGKIRHTHFRVMTNRSDEAGVRWVLLTCPDGNEAT